MRPDSDIDLMAIEDISFQALIELLMEIEEKAGREIDQAMK